VIFGTDHGDQLLEHGLVDKNVFFEASVHVPLLVRLPGRIEPGRRRELTEMIDVMPSVLKLCGVPVPPRVQGRDFGPREMVFSENIIPEIITGGQRDFYFVPGEGVKGIRHPDAKMVRTERWKLTHYPGHGGELYDLSNDPGEERNLYEDAAHKAMKQDLQGAILDWVITADENDQIAPRWLLG
jgi:arylsulfatase